MKWFKEYSVEVILALAAIGLLIWSYNSPNSQLGMLQRLKQLEDRVAWLEVEWVG